MTPELTYDELIDATFKGIYNKAFTQMLAGYSSSLRGMAHNHDTQVRILPPQSEIGREPAPDVDPPALRWETLGRKLGRSLINGTEEVS